MDRQRQQLDDKSSHFASSHHAKLSKIETMPTEILEPIFLNSRNGNLLIAAPRVAAKLKSPAGYRAAFLIAFYSHQLEEITRLMGVDYLIHPLDHPVQAWDIRSMTKAVLNSRWCTCGWTRDFLFSLFKRAVEDAKTVIHEGSSFMGKPVLEHSSLEIYTKYGLSLPEEGTDSGSLSPLSPNHFNICLELLVLEEDDDDDDDDDDSDVGGVGRDADHWRFDKRYFSLDETVFRQLQWKFCGCVTMQGLDFERYRTDTAVREMVFDLIKEKLFYGSEREDFSTLADRVVGSVHFANFVSFGKCPLWEYLAIDYYFRPEDDIFTIPPSLYRAAAAMDILMRPSDDKWYRMHFLFEIDPFNLPRTDDYIIAWAWLARKRLQEDLIQQVDYGQLKILREGRVSFIPYVRDLKHDVQAEYERVMDRSILKYLNGGYVKPQERRLWPNFDCSQQNECIPALVGKDNIVNKARRYYSRLQLSMFSPEILPVQHVFRDNQNMYTSAIWGESIAKNGYLPGSEHNNMSFLAIAEQILQREGHNDMDSIDWAVTRGRYDEESQEILEDDNEVPHWLFEAPKWWTGEPEFAYLKELLNRSDTE